MTKAELIERVCKENDGLSKKAGAAIVDSVFNVMATSISDLSKEGADLKAAKLSYPGFGTFLVRERKARTGRDPRTNQEIQIPASRTVGFRPAKALKESL
jgi:DNA-binding protein HU-beta